MGGAIQQAAAPRIEGGWFWFTHRRGCHIAARSTPCQPVDHDPLTPLFSPLTTLKGVGPTVGALIAKVAGGERVIDLLFHLPESYLDRRQRPTIAQARPGQIATLAVEVVRHEPPANAAPALARGGAPTAPASPNWCSSSSTVSGRCRSGAKLLVSGKVELFNGRRTMPHPEHVVPADRPELLPAIEPVWPLTAGLWPRQVANAMAQALAPVAGAAGMARRGAAAAREMAGVRRGAARGAGAQPSCPADACRVAPRLRRVAGGSGGAGGGARAGAGPARPRPDRRRQPARQGAGALRLHADRVASAGAGGDRRRPGVGPAHAAAAARRCRLRQDAGGAAGDAARGGGRRAGGADGADRGAGEAASPHAVAPVAGAGGAADRRR